MILVPNSYLVLIEIMNYVFKSNANAVSCLIGRIRTKKFHPRLLVIRKN